MERKFGTATLFLRTINGCSIEFYEYCISLDLRSLCNEYIQHARTRGRFQRHFGLHGLLHNEHLTGFDNFTRGDTNFYDTTRYL